MATSVGCRRLATLCLLVVASGCLESTPFGAEPDERDLNRRNVARLLRGEGDPRNLRIVAMSDTHAEYDALARTVSALNTDRLDMVLHLGDQTNMGLLREFEWTRDALRDTKAPLLFTIGNHDAISNGAAIYRRMYGSFDYSFDYAGFHFVVFNSNPFEFPGRAPDLDWLSAEILGRKARSVVLATHQGPMASDASEVVRERYRALLKSGSVALWLHGHVAGIERELVEGVPVVRTGTYEDQRQHVRIVFDGKNFTFERCAYEACSPLFVAPEEPSTVMP